MEAIKNFILSQAFIMWVLAIPVLFGVFYFVKMMFPAYQDDNLVEIAIEDMIDSNAHIKIDLTPDSKEADDRWEKKE